MSFVVANLTAPGMGSALWVRGTGIREIGSKGLSSDQVGRGGTLRFLEINGNAAEFLLVLFS